MYSYYFMAFQNFQWNLKFIPIIETSVNAKRREINEG